MAHMWLPDPAGGSEMCALPLDRSGSGYLLTASPREPVRLLTAKEARPSSVAAVSLVTVLPCPPSGWALLAGPTAAGVSVNGLPLRSGARRLRERDEIRRGGVRFFYTGESLAEVVPFPGTEQVTHCVRCKTPIAEGTPAVRCPDPSCGLWHHQDVDTCPCWTGFPDKTFSSCAMCQNPATLEGLLRWRPEEV